MRFVSLLAVPAILALAGCGKSSGPTVYVLDGSQEVTLTPTASATKVQRGETVTLHVARRTTGQWKKVPRSELAPGQCWVYQPPPADEPEVAQSLKWRVDPEGAVEFHMEVQMNQTRLATMATSGKIQLVPVSEVKCEATRTVTGPTLEIEVS